MEFDTVKMSSKGQIVIPHKMRKKIGAGEGTTFTAIEAGDKIILKKQQDIDKEKILADLEESSKKYRKILESKGFTEEDLRNIHT